MRKLPKICYGIEVTHENRRYHFLFRSEVENLEKAYEMIRWKVCDEIAKMVVDIRLKSGEYITKELGPEDIKDMWIEEE